MYDHLEFRKFNRQDFDIYHSWFADSDLTKALEGIDDKWLEYILQEDDGLELAVTSDDLLVAVIGLILPDKSHKSYAITNIAVRPALRNKGLGSKILKELTKQFKLKEGEYWLSYVEKFNLKAQQFFMKNGWNKIIANNEKEMIKYVLMRAQ